MSLFTSSQVRCEDLVKAPAPIQTGIGFLDHMIDQINSHAQVGVGLTVHHHVDLASLTNVRNHNNNNNNSPRNDHNDEKGNSGTSGVEVSYEDRNRLAACDQSSLLIHVGWTLGRQLSLLNKFLGLDDDAAIATSRFCCPLDEALVECVLTKPSSSITNNHKKKRKLEDATAAVALEAHETAEGRLVRYELAPFGIYPKGKGRSSIGKLHTAAIEEFWKALAKSSGMEISLIKLRGDNGHHIVESSFKAFSRAFRNLLDGTDTKDDLVMHSGYQQAIWGVNSANWKASLALNRTGTIERSTKETTIQVHLALDGGAAGVSVQTGIQTLNDFFTTLAKEACASLRIECTGDLWVDDHHTAEDVAIAVGQVLTQALGTKAGLNRMWCVQCPVGASNPGTVEVTMDLSNRPCLTHNLGLAEFGEEMIGDLSVEMLNHVLDSLVVNASMTVHVLMSPEANGTLNGAGPTLKLRAMATAAAFGKALKYCAMVDSRRAGQTASSKGTLSV